MADRLTTLQDMIKPAVEALDFELWGIEYNGQGKYSMLRVFIEKEGGIGIEDCAEVSRQISSILDVEDPINGEYTLEVSSPGIDRPLFTIEQYTQYVGFEAKVQLRVKFENQRNFIGVISGVENDEVKLVIDDEQITLPYELIEKANLISRV